MKTIMDAVNELKGDLENIEQSNCPAEFIVASVITGAYYRSLVCEDPLQNIDDYRKVCTVREFNSIVAELSHAAWIKGASLAEYQAADKEVLTVENKTVEVDGMVYELDKSYVTNCLSIGILKGLASPRGFSMAHPNNSGTFLCNGLATNDKWTTGTITLAPVKLVDGAAYEFTSKFGKYCGFYLKCSERFTIHPDGTYVLRSDALNITRLVPEVKL